MTTTQTEKLRPALLTMEMYDRLPRREQARIHASFTPEEWAEKLVDWRFMGREEQQIPPGDWTYWLYMAGRGAGKTRTGAETVREWVKQGYKWIGLIAPTAGDARDVMVEGESGLLAVCQDADETYDGEKMGKPLYEPSKRRVTWANGAQATLFSADEPERLRGPQHEKIWADELCAWRRPHTWDLALFGLRLGDHPQAFISTTPKPKKVIIDLVKDPASIVTRGSTMSNKRNLARSFLKVITDKYGGTELGRQELDGELLEESKGALWKRSLIEKHRVPMIPQGPGFYFKRIVVAVDPAVTAKSESNETGIVVAGLASDNQVYVLSDLSDIMTPAAWASRVSNAYTLWQADMIVAEGNQGGDLVKSNIQTANSNLPVKIVHASRGKVARAEPVAALYEQGKVHHVGVLGDLEDQMCVWEPLSGDASPDRLDALVWAVTDLALGFQAIGQVEASGTF